MACVRFGGFIGVIGFVGGEELLLNIRQLVGPMIRMQGIVVGSRATLESVIRLFALHRLKPVVDSCYPLERSAEALRRMKRGEHVGKIVITI